MICKDFIEKHGSKLYVESEIGNGSTFRFNIPFYGKATKEQAYVDAFKSIHVKEGNLTFIL